MRIKQALGLASLACNAAIAQQCPLQWVPSPQHGAPGCTLMPQGGLPWGPPGAPTRFPLFNWQRGGGLPPLLLARSEIPYYGLVFGDRMVEGVAAWDGIRWQTLPAPAFSAPIFAEFNGDLLVRGQGTAADFPYPGIAVARWDGTGWRAMGNSLRDPNNNWPTGTAIAVLNGQLVVGGRHLFDDAGHPCQVARWDGESWHAMNVDPPELYYPPSSFGQWQGEWYSTWGAPGTNAVLKRWNGQSWVPANDGVGGLYEGTLLEFEDNLYLSTSWGWNNGSRFSLARRTETGWATVDNTGVAILSTPMGLIGTWEVTELPPWGRERGAQVIVWNGQGWSTLGEPLLAIGWPNSGPLVLKLAWYAGELVVSGSFTRAGNQSLSGVARWDGSSWQPLGAGLTPSHGARLLQDAAYGSDGPLTIGAQTRYLAVHGSAFRQANPTAGGAIFDQRGVRSTIGSGGQDFWAPVNLPNGANVTEVRIAFIDNILNQSAFISVGYGRSDFQGGTLELATVDSSLFNNSTLAREWSTNIIDYPTVDNATHSYWLRASIPGTSSAEGRLFHVRITYTVTSPLP